MELKAISASRISSIDALRGLAVILMIQQHLLGWLWKRPVMDFQEMARQFPLMMTLNGLGMLAAPLFIALAGWGASTFLIEQGRKGILLLKRGGALLLTGYLLNLLTPHWFSPGSWFVLHLIGASLLLAPLLVRLKSGALLSLYFMVLLISVLLQYFLNTPLLLTEEHMRNLSLPGSVLRLALAEGQFPLFPWLALFVLGMASARWFSEGRRRRFFLLALSFFGGAVVLSLLYKTGLPFFTRGPLFRLFVPTPYMFPALTPYLLIASAFVLLMLGLSARASERPPHTIMGVLSPLGRVSLTAFLSHILLFCELSRLLGFYEGFSERGTVTVIVLVLLVYIILAKFWSRWAFCGSVEDWLKRLTA